MPAIRPTPSNRQPLHTRRNVGLNICTSISPGVDVVVEGTDEQRGRKLQRTYNTGRHGVQNRTTARTPKYPYTNKEFVPLRKSNRSPFKRPAPPPPISPTSSEELDSFLDLEDPDRTLVATDPTTDFKDYHEIVPRLFLVVSSVSFDSDIPIESFKDDFTHVIRVAQAEEREIWAETEEEPSVDVLNLSFPIKATPPSSMRITKTGRRVRNLGTEIQEIQKTKSKKVTDLSGKQLEVARDFLSLCLPYYSQANPPSPSIPKFVGTPAKALIIAPAHVDALSIVITYLAFCSGEHAFRVINYIDEEPEVPDVWRNVFPRVKAQCLEDTEIYYGEGAEKVELAARLDI
ncbi:hypothetical protein BDQ17DRAFT_1432332 [Cyathus striatus]|nr:hypothetical protein BDQ17DRAFT_1432332 [Cyathus striatus]